MVLCFNVVHVVVKATSDGQQYCPEVAALYGSVGGLTNLDESSKAIPSLTLQNIGWSFAPFPTIIVHF